MANFEHTSVNTISRWRRALHWLSALAVVGAAGVAITMTDLDISTPEAAASAKTWYSGHKTLGTVVLILTLIRLFSMALGSRVTHSPHRASEIFAAAAIQRFLLCALLVLPFTGLAMHAFTSGAAPIWLIPEAWLSNVPKDPTVVRLMVSIHHLLAWTLIVAVALHLAGALKHHIIDRDGTLRRMLSGHPDPMVFANPSAELPKHLNTGNRLGFVGFVTVIAIGAAWHFIAPSDSPRDADLGVSSATGDWQSIPDQGELRIGATQGGEYFEASFQRFAIQIAIDTAGEPTNIGVTLDSGSFISGMDERDQTVYGADWLDVENFPVVDYQTRAITKSENDTYSATGDLTIREVTANVPITFSLQMTDEPAGMLLTGKAGFDRFDLQLGRGDYADESSAGRQIDIRFSVPLSDQK